jgi:hypothetical protein
MSNYFEFPKVYGGQLESNETFLNIISYNLALTEVTNG